MFTEFINVGTELLLGQVLNTHQQWLARRLADRGYTVDRQVTVLDTGPDIREAVRAALDRANLVITTGGLGPTSDDLTRQQIAGLLGLELREDPEVLRHIKSFFANRKRPMPDSTCLQAQVPEGATVLPNSHGTAPGLAIEVRSNPSDPEQCPAWLLMLPGPPRELRPMFQEHALPLIQNRFPIGDDFHCLVLRTTGIGESLVEEKIQAPLRSLLESRLELGFCARVGEVDIRLSCRGKEAENRIREARTIIEGEVGRHIYGIDDDLLEEKIVSRLREQGATLALAESCTGGFIAHRITNVPGASDVFRGGLITYCNKLKLSLLEVRAATLSVHGAVSRQTAIEMAVGALQVTDANHALSVTGIAGPSGGTEDKPVGTVWIGLASRGCNPLALKQFNPLDRETFKFATSQQALEMLRRRLVFKSGGEMG